jgi:GT2 family glycosyltransferase
LNPDVILQKDAIKKIIDTSKEIDSFAVLAPISNNKNFPNYKILNKSKEFNKKNYFKVDSIDGFAMILNLKKINKFNDFKNFRYFDENFFMYLENDDFCKRITDQGENIYVIKNAKIKHLGAKAVNERYSYEIELSRNWHWMWSKFYYNKKYYGFFAAVLRGLPSFLSSILKFFIYKILNKKKKEKIYFQRISGFFNALIGINSFYRPKIKNKS